MKTSKKPAPESSEFHEKLIKQLTPEEITSALVSVVGLSNLAHEFIWECVRGFIELPIQIKYSLVQHASFARLLYRIQKEDLLPKEIDIQHMPIDENAWKSDEDFEKRFIFVVNQFYEQLKKEGKL